jgi:RNA polymerase sigma-70 factor, ECF subfamily
MALAREVADTETFFEPSQSVHRSQVRDADAMLVQSLRLGEEAGYETLVRKFGPQVMAIARRYLRSEADAADCFQDTFIAVFQNIEKFQQRSSFRQWVRGVSVKQCLMKIRKQQRRREDSIEHMLPMFNDRGKRVGVASPRQKSEIGDMLDAEKIRRLVRENIDRLPQDHRLVLLLRDIDGYSTSDTACILGIKVNAVKTRLHRARSALKFMLQPQLEQ